MESIRTFIDGLLNSRGLTRADEEDLRIELMDHMMLLKQEYIDKGYTEEEAIALSIKNLGDVNEIGSDIKRFLPSRNRYSQFPIFEMVKLVLFMLVTYFATLLCIGSFEEINYKGMYFFVITTAIPVVVSFIYINVKLTSKAKRVKNMVISLLVFFSVERLIMLLIYFVGSEVYANEYFQWSNLVNLKYIGVYFSCSAIVLIITALLSEDIVLKIRNPYNSKMLSNILWIFSMILMMMYYLLPNRWYLLCRLMERIIGNDITYFSKNILYLTINHEIIIPNIGLGLFVFIAVKTLRNIRIDGNMRECYTKVKD